VADRKFGSKGMAEKFPWSKSDLRFMDLAFAEARKVKGKTLPNPAVGAVLVKAGKVVGKGGTRPAGQSHAEVVALSEAGAKARGSILYVTLEPCCHHGRTPPCTLAVIAAGVKEVVIAAKDANPVVGGKGIQALRRAGILVRLGLRAEEAAAFYRGFFFRIQNGRPLILLKIAQSVDGRINARPGEETPITGEESKAWVHALRAHVDAVLIGGRTLRVDDPKLTPRKVAGPVPEAVVLSRRGPFPPNAHLFAKGRPAKTVVVCESDRDLPRWVDRVLLSPTSTKRRIPLQEKTSQSASKTRDKDRVLATLLALFKDRGYHSVMVEGGRELWSLFLNAGLWDSLYILTAPIVLPEGERWDAELAQDWGKSLKFRNFASFGRDYWVDFGNSESNG